MREKQDAATPAAAARRAASLCVSAGYADASGYFHLAYIVAASMSGNTVFLGTGLATGLAAGDWNRAVTNAITIGAFFLGAVLASLLRRASDRSSLGLLLAAGLLVPIHLVPLTTREQLVLLACAMGTQGASLRHFGPARLQTVVVTGTLLHLADTIASASRRGPCRRDSAEDGMAVLTLGSWAAYGAGAALDTMVSPRMAVPLALPIALLLLTAADLAFSGSRPGTDLTAGRGRR